MRRWFSLALIALLASGCVTTNKSSGQSGSLRLQDIDFTFSSFLPSEISVRSSGSAPTEKEAIDNALTAAVKQAMGVLIVSELSISQEKIVDDLAASYSSGVVKKYKKVECVSGSRVTCTIDAVVTPWGIRNRIYAASSEANVSGKDLYAEYMSKQHVAYQRRVLINYYFDTLWERGLVPKVRSVELAESSRPKIKLRYSVTWDSDFRREFMSFIRKLERDTGGGGLKKIVMGSLFGTRSNGLDPCWGGQGCDDLKIEWGIGLETAFLSQSANLKLKDKNLANLIRNKLARDVSFRISPFGICDTFDGSEEPGWGRLPDMYMKRELELDVKPEQLRNVNTVKITQGC
jgi:hypothetical protein